MAREYIARDPRTGRPLNVAKPKRVDKTIVSETGPWVSIADADVFPLARGEIDHVVTRYLDENHTHGRSAGVRSLGRFSGRRIHEAHGALMLSFEQDDPAVRVAALQVLPEIAVRKSDELFDWLSVLLDDSNEEVRLAASHCLTRTAPVFPSAVETILGNELRSSQRSRFDAAWAGLNGLCETWPEVVVNHIDTLLLEEDPKLRRKAAGLLRRVIQKGGSPVWDLISWSLNDADVEVRRIAARTLPSLAKRESRIATVFAERAMVDEDSKVRLSGIKALQSVDTDHGRARELVVKGTTSKDLQVRKACVDLLPRLFGEDVLRTMAIDLLKTETDAKIIASLKEMMFDASIDGTEAQKNAQLAPAAPVPAIDREIAEAHGKMVGLEPVRPGGPAPEDASSKPDGVSQPAEPQAAAGSYRAVSQDEMMGYTDEFEDEDPDDDDEYF
jgi:HEAT repeat protein